MATSHASENQTSTDVTYFTCTLDQAATLQSRRSESWLTVNHLIDHQYLNSPDLPALGFPIPVRSDIDDQDGEWEYALYSFAELRTTSLDYAARLRDILGPYTPSRTVALLCPSSVDFLFTWLGLLRLGFSVLLIAPQCQPPAIAHLCKQSDVRYLFYDEIHQRLAAETHEAAAPDSRLDLIPLPLYNGSQASKAERLAPWAFMDAELLPVSAETIAYYHHTSGTSTGLPKPIPLSHRGAVGVLPTCNNGKEHATFTTTPLYHGGVADCFRAWTSSALIWLFPGREVPITAVNILKSLRCSERASEENNASEVDYFSSVPYVLEMMSGDPQGLLKLQSMSLVGVGGTALSDIVGNDLVERGVRLVSRYGSTECGFLMSSHRNYATDKAWQYLRDSRLGALRFEPLEDGLAELVVEPQWPFLVKQNREDGSFATADLFEPHPTIPNAWRYHSRADAQLNLSNGKKFDPQPIEALIATAPVISDVLIFGNGQLYPGALIFRTAAASKLTNEEMLDRIWPLVAAVNEKEQPHSRLRKSMCIIMPAGVSELEKSSKGTILRRQAEAKFATEITKAYTDIPSPQDALQRGTTWTIPDHQVPEAVNGIIKSVIDKPDPIGEDEDFFSYGVDSIACMQIRNALQQELQTNNLPLNIVYDCGSSRQLSNYLVKTRSGKETEGIDEIRQMQSLVSDYSHFTGTLRPTVRHQPLISRSCLPGPWSQVVVLTGATGALGAHILDQLLCTNYVAKIHCLVRASSASAAHERISKSLVARKKAPLQSLSPDGRDTAHKVICHPCKLSDSLLGLGGVADQPDLFGDLADTATVIIHAAWAVNFSMRLTSFTRDHIAGAQNIINFALASRRTVPPRLIFCSSTASVLGPSSQSPIFEKVSHDPHSASPLGYSRSKWVAEAVFEQAHITTRLHDRIKILRVGQLCGDTRHGIWNKTEAWPLMLSTAPMTDALPSLNDNLSWLPVDIAAKAVIEAATSEWLPRPPTIDRMRDIAVYHILNPHSEPSWQTMIHWMSRDSPISAVTPKEWIQLLEQDIDSNHPARKLLGLWKNTYGELFEHESKEFEFKMHDTRMAVPTMIDVQPITQEIFVKLWNWIKEEMVWHEGGA